MYANCHVSVTVRLTSGRYSHLRSDDTILADTPIIVARWYGLYAAGSFEQNRVQIYNSADYVEVYLIQRRQKQHEVPVTTSLSIKTGYNKTYLGRIGLGEDGLGSIALDSVR